MPLVQLDFPNPLNTSVQIGDTAYFSNPIEYGTTGNPLSGDQWASTTTPHLTSNQSDIIKIGVITEIITWDGTVSSIICDMPQNLFNQYFSDIQSVVCTFTIDLAQSSGNCATLTPTLNHPVAERGVDGFPPYTFPNDLHPSNPLYWLFDNPSVKNTEVMFHNSYPQNFVAPISQTFPPVDACHVDSQAKNDYVANATNLWLQLTTIEIMLPNIIGVMPNIYSFPSSASASHAGNDFNPGQISNGDRDVFTVEPFSGDGWSISDVLDKLNGLFASMPGFVSYVPGINFSTFKTQHQTNMDLFLNTYGNLPANFSSSANTSIFIFEDFVNGSIGFNADCTGQGSFIMFSKDNKVNLSSVLGYYASATFRNDSTEKAELFNVGADIFESSK